MVSPLRCTALTRATQRWKEEGVRGSGRTEGHTGGRAQLAPRMIEQRALVPFAFIVEGGCGADYRFP